MKKGFIWILAVFAFITLFFFYPLLQGKIPFPGDLLIGEYSPYRSYSYLGFNPGSYPNKGQNFDVIRLIYPAKEFSVSEIKKGEMPLWNPYNFSGNPHLASLQSGTFYPLNLLFFVFPFVGAWTLYIFLQPILAAFFTYLLLREYKLSVGSAIFGGAVFAFSSFVTVWLEYGNVVHSFLWLPLILFFINKNFKRPNITKSFAISLILGLTIFAGYIQMSMYVFIFSFAYILFNILFIYKKERLKSVFLNIAIFVYPIFIAAIQLIPMIQLFAESSRSSYSVQDFLKLLIPYYHGVTFFVPDFFGNPATRNYWLEGTYIERVSYIGIVPIIFVFYSLSRKITKTALFYFISVVSIFFLAFDTFITKFLYSIYIPPIISTGVPSRMMFLFAFSTSVLAAFGMDAFGKKIRFKKIFLISALLVIVFGLLWIFVFFSGFHKSGELSENLKISQRNLLLPTFILGSGIVMIFSAFIFKKIKKIILLGLIVLAVGDLFYFFHKITPFSPLETVYPRTEVLEQLKKIQGVDRSWGYGSGYIESNIQTHEGVFGTDGYDALHLKRYGEFLTSTRNGNIEYPIPRSEALLASGYGNEDLKLNNYRQRALNLLGVKYILNKTDEESALPDMLTFPEDIYSLVWQGGVWQIYENKQVLPRFFLTSSYVVEKNSAKIIEKIYSDEDPKRVILEEVPDFGDSLKQDLSATVRLESYSPNKIVLNTKAEENMLLFLSDTYDSGWRAEIDEGYAKIYRANYAFRALSVPRGEHEIVFTYAPKAFKAGFVVSAGSLLIGFLAVLTYKRKKR